MANGWSLIISIIFIAVFSVAAWFLSPKGDTQTIWRSTLILSAWSCWLMWAITFLAQWHPLIVPERGDLRPEYNNGPIKSGRMFQ
ncbi:hypothetical protein D0869_02782 [Hortaea werneckii]|uniref:V-type proton ATPase subunit n=1 Tax=Hortaea werneckii TaxID=91943 RepID=A0A3M6X875_HORWE|nr:hypothetical protein KC324_g6602 [Hortaea werneckii]KAI7584742.1 hypothetical protein KC316_g6527 [Hortaea werneckii]RMX86859.1 hypothetical protein D0869_02782 [Hortaea werneckii]